MNEYATKFADLLEQAAKTIKSMTVDRINQAITLTGLGIITATLAFTALIFLLWAIFGALEIPLTTGGAFAVLSAMLLGIGSYLWFNRSKEEEEE